MKNLKTMAMKLINTSITLGICLLLLACEAPPTGSSNSNPTKTGTKKIGKVADNRLIQLEWMVGNWIDEDGNDISQELWTESAGGTMFGINRTIVDGETVNFEYMRIQITPQGIVYFAAPRGRHPPTPFGLTQVSSQSAVFYNGDKEAPLRVSYRRQGNTLFGRIEGEVDGQVEFSEWSWKLASP